MGILDFLQDWSIQTLILVAAVLAVITLAGSFGLAFAWRKWKERRRHRNAGRGRPPTPTSAPPSGAPRRGAIRKLPFGAQRK